MARALARRGGRRVASSVVTPRLCHNCRAALFEPEDGAVPRCGKCGTLQVRLSEEARAESAAERQRYDEALASHSLPQGARGQTRWKTLILLAAGAAVAAVPLCALVPSLITVAWLLPVPVLLLYSARFSGVALTPLAGARVGAITGFFCSAGAALAGTVYLMTMRFGLHRMGGFDAFLAAVLAATRRQALLQNGPEAATRSAVLALPEFRAGLLVLMMLALAAAFVFLCVVCGMLAAAVQRQRGPKQAG